MNEEQRDWENEIRALARRIEERSKLPVHFLEDQGDGSRVTIVPVTNIDRLGGKGPIPLDILIKVSTSIETTEATKIEPDKMLYGITAFHNIKNVEYAIRATEPKLIVESIAIQYAKENNSINGLIKARGQ